MNAEEQLDKLNRGEHVVTYELLQVARPDRARVAGEVRYLVPLVPMPGEELASMIGLPPVQIIWTGAKWERVWQIHPD